MIPHKGGVLFEMPIVIKARPGESTDALLRKFQKRVLAEGLVAEIRNREFYKKPSMLRQEYLAEKRRKIRRYKRNGS